MFTILGMIERHLRIRKDSKSSFFLFGARGTGKTTLLKNIFSKDEALFIDLLDPVEQDLFAREPRELERRALGLAPERKWIVIDEIQKVPKLLDIVHRLIESGDRLFAMTGSSSRKLKRGVSNLLAGRAFVYNLFPFSASELGDRFELLDGLKWGMLPKIQEFDDDLDKQHFLRAYALTYIKEEIQEEQLIRKLDPFRQFLEIAAQANGKIVNYSKIAEDVGVATQTVISYFSILEETLIGFTLMPYHRSVRKRQRNSPKFYLLDTGIKRALDRTLTVDINERTYAFGDAFEHFVIMEIVKNDAYDFPDWQFSYLNTGADREIDLIIDRPGHKTALIEIKSTETILERHAKVLNSLCKDIPDSTSFCVSRDKNRKLLGSVLCLHWTDIYKELRATGGDHYFSTPVKSAKR